MTHDEHREPGHVEQHLQTARKAVCENSPHQLGIDPHSTPRAELLAMGPLQGEQQIPIAFERRCQSPVTAHPPAPASAMSTLSSPQPATLSESPTASSSPPTSVTAITPAPSSRAASSTSSTRASAPSSSPKPPPTRSRPRNSGSKISPANSTPRHHSPGPHLHRQPQRRAFRHRRRHRQDPLETNARTPPRRPNRSPNIYPSLCLAGKYLVIGNDAGDTALFEPAENPTPLATNDLPPGSGSTPIFTAHQIFTRSGKFLICISAP